MNVAVSEYQEKNRLFNSQNWLKAKDSILKVQAAVNMYMGLVDGMQGGRDLRRSLTLPPDKFMLRWAAD
jgi:hypothetical protein